MANYAQIRKMDISDGPGVRVAVYFQGCDIHCPGCHNETLWDFSGGHDFNEDSIKKIIDLAQPDYIAGLSILGGEPLAVPNLRATQELVVKFKKQYPNKTIWLWTGHKFETLWNIADRLEQIDVIVDSPYIESLKDPRLKYAGSSNQRVIDVKKSLMAQEVILYK